MHDRMRGTSSTSCSAGCSRLQPDDFKPMPSIGNGLEAIRVWEDSGPFRVIYTARLQETGAVCTRSRGRDRQ